MKAELAVAFDALEVVDNSDAESSEAVGEGEERCAPGELPKQGLTGPPREGDVAGPKGVVPEPAVLFQLEWRC